MKIVIIGGTGLIGTKLAGKLRQKGHEVVAAAPSTGVNTVTGETRRIMGITARDTGRTLPALSRGRFCRGDHRVHAVA